MSYIIDRIKLRLHKKNKNFVLAIVGECGSGKSWTALNLAEKIDPDFNAKKQVVFTARQFLDLVNKGELKKGQVIIFDEAGVDYDSREWFSVMNKMLNHFLQTWRHRNLCLILTTPLIKFIDSNARPLLNAYLEMRSIDRVKKQSMGVWYNLSINYRTGKVYAVRPRRKIGLVPSMIKTVRIGLPSLKTRRAYEKIADEFKRGIAMKAETEIKGVEEKLAAKRKKKDFGTMVEYVAHNSDEFENDKGKISSTKIRMKFNLGRHSSSEVAKAAKEIM